MAHYVQERHEKLGPVVLTIFFCYLGILGGAYLVAQLF